MERPPGPNESLDVINAVTIHESNVGCLGISLYEIVLAIESQIALNQFVFDFNLGASRPQNGRKFLCVDTMLDLHVHAILCQSARAGQAKAEVNSGDHIHDEESFRRERPLHAHTSVCHRARGT